MVETLPSIPNLERGLHFEFDSPCPTRPRYSTVDEVAENIADKSPYSFYILMSSGLKSRQVLTPSAAESFDRMLA